MEIEQQIKKLMSLIDPYKALEVFSNHVALECWNYNDYHKRYSGKLGEIMVLILCHTDIPYEINYIPIGGGVVYTTHVRQGVITHERRDIRHERQRARRQGWAFVAR